MVSSRAVRAAPSAGRKNRKQRVGAVARRRYDGSAAQTMVTRLKALDFFNSITLFGAMFLLSALPLMVLVSSFANRRIEHDLTHHLGLNAQAAAVVEGLFRHSHTRAPVAVAFALPLGFAGTVGAPVCREPSASRPWCKATTSRSSASLTIATAMSRGSSSGSRDWAPGCS